MKFRYPLAFLAAAVCGCSPADNASNGTALAQQQSAADAKAVQDVQLREIRDDLIFDIIARAYRSLAVKPVPGEDVRRFKVQADDAVEKKQFADANKLYVQASNIAIWWPEGHFNNALILGEMNRFHWAIREMKRYLALVPDASNARQAQDKIYVWERGDKTPPPPDPAQVLTIPQDGKPHLGAFVADVPPVVAAAAHLPDTRGALISYTVAGSAAAALSPGDIIVSFAGQPVQDASALVQTVSVAARGTVTPIELVRDGHRMTVLVTL